MKRLISIVLLIAMILAIIPSNINTVYGEPKGRRGSITKLLEAKIELEATAFNVTESEAEGGVDAIGGAAPYMTGRPPIPIKVPEVKSNNDYTKESIIFKQEMAKVRQEEKITDEDNEVADELPAPPIIIITDDTDNYKEKMERKLVKEASMSKGLFSYMSNIAMYFSERFVTPPHSELVSSMYNDRNKNGIYDTGDLKIAKEFSVNYEKELRDMESENIMTSNTRLFDIRDMVALYLYNSDTYTPIDGQTVGSADVEAYKSDTPNSEIYNWPVNIPVYENKNFKGSYNLAKDSHIVNGRNNTIDNFIKAYKDSYDMAYYNVNRDEKGLKVKRGIESEEIILKYSIFAGGQTIAGQNFKTVNNKFGGVMDFELFAMSFNNIRTVIGFQDDIKNFVNYNNITEYATLGRGIFKAPITNLLYTGGVPNELGKDFAEYVGYYKYPYEDNAVINTLVSNSSFRDKPARNQAIYLENIVGNATKDELIKAIKTGILRIDDDTEARSFNPDVVFGYYNILNGKLIENGSKSNTNWFKESDMTDINEGLFYHKQSKTGSGLDITRIYTTPAFQKALQEGKLKQQQDAYLNHFAITEFPTMFTWGQGMGMRNTGKLWYIDVPLAPLAMVKDVEIVEEYTIDNIDGTKLTALTVKLDNMPYLPDGISEDDVIVNVIGKDVEVISMFSLDVNEVEKYNQDEMVNTDSKPYQDYKSVEFKKEKYKRIVDGKQETFYDRVWKASEERAYYKKTVSVTWKAKDTATPDSKVIFTANLVPDDNYAFLTSKDTSDMALERNAVNDRLYPQIQNVNNWTQKYGGETVKYIDIYPETTLSNNYVVVDIKPVEVDLGLDSFAYNYSKSTGKATIDIIGFLLGKDLEASKGELPVEVRLDWKTWDGQSGTQTLTSNTLKEANTYEVFTFEMNISSSGGEEPGGTFTVEINPKDIPKEANRDNNKYVGTEFGEINVNTLDFDVYVPFSTAPVIKDGVKTTADFKAYVTLNNSETTENTVVTLYKANGTVLNTRNVTIAGGNTLTLNYSLPIDDLTEGANNLRITVNTDFEGKSASPVTTEINLANNIYDFSLNKINTIGNPAGCFNTSNDNMTYRTNDYIKTVRHRDCDVDEKGKKTCDTWYEDVYECRSHDLTLSNDVMISSKEGSKLKSDLWSDDINAQIKVTKNPLYPKALNGSGGDFEDPLLSKYIASGKLKELKQVIRAGHGLKMEAMITIEGTVQNVGSKSTVPQAILNQVINGTYLNGDGEVNGANYPDIKNNEGKLEQKMELNGTESRIVKTESTSTEKYGDSKCGSVKTVYTTTFKYEVPMKLSDAVGKIAVNTGGNEASKPDVPKKPEWFVYLNQPDNVGDNPHIFKVESTINWSAIGASGVTDCKEQIDAFNVGVYGTMYDLINTGGNNDDGDDGGWDN